jgi:hypothetical protein
VFAMPFPKNKRRERSEKELWYWYEVTIEILKNSDHWQEVFKNQKDLTRAIEKGEIDLGMIEILSDDLRKMKN